ncbi:hypothetical protein RHS03_06212, partial [Rhizoctonia solani]
MPPHLSNMSPYKLTLASIAPSPKGDDPLTENELSLSLAIPRAAESSLNSTLFRLPLGSDPSMGSIDATCAEMRSIVAHLAEVWQRRLSSLSIPDESLDNTPFGPGITTCLLVEPSYEAIFHLLALWGIGCTVQFISVAMEPYIIDSQLDQSGCKVLLHSGFDDAWVKEHEDHFRGAIIQLPDEERASRLVHAPPPWPIPRRPTPALILQSSATTRKPKILRFPLHIYTIGHAYNCQTYLQSANTLGGTSKTPYTHPRLVLSPPYWQSFYRSLFVHLTTATPLAFAHVRNVLDLSPNHIIGWARALDAGAIASAAGLIRQIPLATWEAHADLFQSLFSFTISGSSIHYLVPVFECLRILITNLYGTSELGRLLCSTGPPYVHLEPYKDAPPPLVLPISDYAPDGSRHVELWYSAQNSYHLAHYFTYGGVPLELEPFPGDGPHKGEIAVNLGDIFKEIVIGDSSETAYIHVGRHSDQIRLGGEALGHIDAASYENQLMSEINGRITRANDGSWLVDGVQLFGMNMQCTALVIQLRPSESDHRPKNQPSEELIQSLYQSVNRLNDHLKLGRCMRVHVKKRTLIITSDGTFVHRSNAGVLAGLPPL